MNTLVFGLCILFGIVWFCAFVYQGKRDDAKHMEELKGQAKQRQQAVIVRRTETERVIQTEKVIIELVPNDKLSQHLTNLTGSIDHHAQVIETTAQILPLSQIVPRNQIGKPVESESVRESVNTPYSIRQSPSLDGVKNGEYDDDICAQRKDGKTVQMIADECGVSKTAIEKRITELKRVGKL